jgi:hypothetical protein
MLAGRFRDSHTELALVSAFSSDQRSGSNVQYNTLTLNGTVYPVNTRYPNQQNWTLEEIDVAFQRDLDSNGDIDNV